jgi:hypothetical protein
MNKIIEKVNIKKSIKTSWIKNNSNLSSGEVILYNFLDKKINLLKNTTLENKDWIQFYLLNNITIPSSYKKYWKIIPWEIKTIINWKNKLLDGTYAWIKSNIWTWELLTIPKLLENKSKIFAKSNSKFKWSSNNFIKILTKEDILNAKIIMKNKLKEMWIKKIKEEVIKSNKNNSIEIELLNIDNIFKINNFKIKIPEHIKIWDEIEKFELYWELSVIWFTYNKEVLISVLKKSINNNYIKDFQKVVWIDEKTLRLSHIIVRNDLIYSKWNYKYISELKEPLKIKATVDIEYIISKIFNNNDILFNKIKYSVIWKDVEKAEQILTNIQEINNVDIKVTPFFLNTVSKISNNIIIKIKE